MRNKVALLACLVSSCLFGNGIWSLHAQNEAEKRISFDFERSEKFEIGDPLNSHESWVDSDDEVIITDAEAATGFQAVKVPAAEKMAMLRGHFPGIEDPTFIDVYVKPAGESYVAMERLGEQPAHTTLSKVVPLADERWASVQVMDGDGQGNGEWVTTNIRIATYEGYPVDWLRFTYRLDYKNARWDFYLNGRLVAGDLGFVVGNVESFTHFTFHGDKAQAVYLDDFTVSNRNPLFPDKDVDGLDDRIEVRMGWDAGRDDRLETLESGQTRLEAYILSLMDQTDSDGDGLSDGEERQLGSDPERPDMQGRAGAVLWERWGGQPRTLDQVKRDGLDEKNADQKHYLQKLEIERESGFGKGEEYISKIRGYLLPPVTGNYQFWVAGDDYVEFWLSKDDTPFKREVVARVTGWTSPRHFDDYAAQRSALMTLEAGKRYYFEVWHKDLVGEDHLAVAWKTPLNARRLIGGEYLQALEEPLANDGDGDGLPDDWEQSYGLNPNSALGPEGSHGDADGDDLSNYDEYRYGGNPTVDDADALEGLLGWDVWREAEGEHLMPVQSHQRNPNRRLYSATLEHYQETDEYFASRFRGHLSVPASGRYRFWMSADNKGEVWLSPTPQPFEKSRIAWVPEYTRAGEWQRYGSQISEWVELKQGHPYYLEIWHKEVVGGSHIHVAWQREGDEEPTLLTNASVRPYRGLGNDLDDDGLPDNWERQVGLGQGEDEGAFGDVDGDGMNQLREYQLGWNPKEADGEGRDGWVTWDAWDNITAPGIEALFDQPLFPEQPNRRGYLDQLMMRDEGYSIYALRVRGLLKAPVGGDYRFWVSGDEEVELWLSASPSKFDRQLIAKTGGATHESEFDLRGVQQSEAITLEAEALYYIEVRHKESWFENHFAVAWQHPGQDVREIIGGQYLRSFSVEANDRDDDDLPDDWEVSHGFDPEDASHEESAFGDRDRDGLRNGEEREAGTLPDLGDSDGDGLSDYAEVLLGTDPTAGQAGEREVASAFDLEAFASLPEAAGQWVLQPYGYLAPEGFRGALRYPFHLEEAGFYFVSMRGRFGGEVPASVNRFRLVLDGEELGYYSLNPTSSQLIARLPYLQTGDFELEIHWDNPHPGFWFELESLTIEGWVSAQDDREKLLGGLYHWRDVPVTSLTSPVCIEGTAWNPTWVTINESAQATASVNGGWFANVSLLEDGEPTEITVRFENGGLEETRAISWKPTNVLGWEQEELRIREGDSLRLTTLLERQEVEDGRGRLEINGEVIADSVTAPIPYRFERAGTYEIKASYTDEEGLVERVLSVQVLPPPFPETTYALTGTTRRLVWPLLDEKSVLEVDRDLAFQETTEDGAPRQFIAGLPYRAVSRVIIARVNDQENAAIYGVTQVTALDVRSGLESYARVVDSLPDGSYLVEMGIVAPALPPGFKMRIDIAVAGVTFDDGTLTKWLTADDFDVNGVAKVRFIKSPETLTSVCHRIEYFVGEEKVN